MTKIAENLEQQASYPSSLLYTGTLTRHTSSLAVLPPEAAPAEGIKGKGGGDEGGGAEVGGVGVAREGRRRVLLGAGMPVLVDRAQGAAAGQVSARVQAVCGRCMTCSMFVCILAIVCETCALANKIHDAPSVVLSCS